KCSPPASRDSHHPHRNPPSLPTRRSSDLINVRNRRRNTTHVMKRKRRAATATGNVHRELTCHIYSAIKRGRNETKSVANRFDGPDRKSTRLNSSHQIISYAVFCLKQKTET